MDSRGWIPIPLLADFKRVRSLTGDVNTVREILMLSKQVEVRDDHVRMLQWAQFVLPTAPRSIIEVVDPQEEGSAPDGAPVEPIRVQEDSSVQEDSTVTEHDEGEEEEEEVEFVLERPSAEA